MIILLYFLSVITVSYFLFYVLKKSKLNWVNPLSLFTINFLLYFLVMPFLILFTESFTVYMVDNPDSLFFRLHLTIFIFFISVIVGYKLLEGTVINKKLINREKQIFEGENNYLLIDILIFNFFLIIFIISFYNFFSSGYLFYIENMSNRIFLTQGKGYYQWGLTLFAPLSVYYLDKYLVNKNKLILILFLLSFVISNLMYISLGFRGRSLILIVTLILLYSIRNKSSIKNVVIATGLLVPLYLLLGVLREYIAGSGLERFSYKFDLIDFVEKAKMTLGVSEYLAILLERYSEINTFVLGKTFFSLLTFPIPSSIFPSKPYGSGPIVSNVISPGVYTIGGEYNTSFTISLIGEGYINFGYFGVLIVGFIFGCALKFLDVLIKKENDYLPIYLVLLVGLVNKVLVGEFLGAMSGILFEIIPLIFVIKISRKIRRKNAKKSKQFI
ncbi:O-antigen polymerase [Planococcus halotolerans]|uniref:Oligosaccharide repeat unit polymerase n=1 Tax=Planococcus halotolerans TaxID=2233542 RepID=A0A365L620_9BACL|nr:O-antigen polymerase [Planococcus halotolerans]RAZ80717.1 hypothetical protein DP120_00035 [Planococcus halotolerans]